MQPDSGESIPGAPQTGLFGTDASGNTVPAISKAPRYSSAPLQWRDVLLERHLLPPGSSAATVMAQHCLIVPLMPRPVFIHWRLNGHPIQGALLHQRAYFRAAGDELASAWGTPLDALFLAVKPEATVLAGGDVSQNLPTLQTDLSGGMIDTSLAQLILRLDAHIRGGRLGGALFEQSMLLACGLRLVALYSPARASAPPASGQLPRRALVKLEDFILSHLSEPLTVDGIADAVGLSTYHLCRSFRKTRAISLWQYVLMCRVTYARRIMEHHPDMPLSEVAAASGFDTYSQFFLAFRKFYRASPRQLRQRGNT